eukprot:NODE_3610_length_2011_cov_5.719745.p1 GENE.NODE_3610_length_2011_cov_5.719745~~NODE_3610_length_2011_cov_5.719745.p1  ORF type:complete len:583 (-),score=188.90 NODE_3610_length_2011_cov_5.719745:261-1895(-)
MRAASPRHALLLATGGSQVVLRRHTTSDATVLRSLRVRFAPSPSGALHVGGARTALFNWLLAHGTGEGTFVLRIEDTDAARSDRKAEAAILDGLRWLGLHWDEGPDVGGASGPYRQSERLADGVYARRVEQLLAEGTAYRCFLSESEIQTQREDATHRGVAFAVESPWATASDSKVRAMLERGAPFACRLRVPHGRRVVLKDLILGRISWRTNDLGGDFVIARPSGVPTYNFACAVDDAAMRITHVVRGQEHLPNTPRQLLVHEALGAVPPAYGHVPLILAPDRSKLSKRSGAASLADFRAAGHMPAALTNYLALLGWSGGGKREIYSLEELARAFSLRGVARTAAVFDAAKCRWVNAQHIRAMSDDDAHRLFGEELVARGLLHVPRGAFLEATVPLLRRRVSLVSECGSELRQLLVYSLDELVRTEAGRARLTAPAVRETAAALRNAPIGAELRARAATAGIAPVQCLGRHVAEARGGGVRGGRLWKPLRLCLTAGDGGVDLGALLEVLELAEADGANVRATCVTLAKRLRLLGEAMERLEPH